MATSGSVNFTVTRNEIIEAALQQIGEIAVGQPMTAEHVTTGSRWLNLIVKQWQGTADFSAGLKVWTRKRIFVFLQTDKHEYAVGASGWHATTSYGTTTINAAEANGQTVISVASTSGMSAAQYIGIQLNDGSLHWTTIVSTGGGPVVTITAAITDAASSGNRVFFYTTKANRPITVLQGTLIDPDGAEAPLQQLSMAQYEVLPKKNADGTPSAFFYEAQLGNGVIYTDTDPTDVTDVMRLVCLSNSEDFDASTDTPDYPQEYNLALVMETAKYLAPVYGRKFDQDMKDNRDVAVNSAKGLYAENSDVHFEPGAPD